LKDIKKTIFPDRSVQRESSTAFIFSSATAEVIDRGRAPFGTTLFEAITQQSNQKQSSSTEAETLCSSSLSYSNLCSACSRLIDSQTLVKQLSEKSNPAIANDVSR
jgi:hypothetical protein